MKYIYLLFILFLGLNMQAQQNEFSLKELTTVEKVDEIEEGHYSIIGGSEMDQLVDFISLSKNKYGIDFSFILNGDKIDFSMFLSEVVSDSTRVTFTESPSMVLKDFGVRSYRGYCNNASQVNSTLVINDDYFVLRFSVNNTTYHLNPVNFLKKNWSSGFRNYVLYDGSKLNIGDTNHYCGSDSISITEGKPDSSDSRMMPTLDCRELNVAVAFDEEIFDNYGSTTNVITHFTDIYLSVSLLYDDEFDHEIDLQITEYYVSQNPNEFWPTIDDGSVLLDNLTNWGGFSSSFEFKELVVARDIEYDDNYGVVGLAYTPGYSSLIEDNASAVVTTNIVTHELGHNLNSIHDAVAATTIMAPFVSPTLNTNWSSASVSDIDSYVGSNSIIPTCPYIWVDYDYNGVFNTGSFNAPFDNLGSAVNTVSQNGTIRIKSSSGDANGILINGTKKFNVHTWNGSSVIGSN